MWMLQQFSAACLHIEPDSGMQTLHSVRLAGWSAQSILDGCFVVLGTWVGEGGIVYQMISLLIITEWELRSVNWMLILQVWGGGYSIHWKEWGDLSGASMEVDLSQGSVVARFSGWLLWRLTCVPAMWSSDWSFLGCTLISPHWLGGISFSWFEQIHGSIVWFVDT